MRNSTKRRQLLSFSFTLLFLIGPAFLICAKLSSSFENLSEQRLFEELRLNKLQDVVDRGRNVEQRLAFLDTHPALAHWIFRETEDTSFEEQFEVIFREILVGTKVSNLNLKFTESAVVDEFSQLGALATFEVQEVEFPTVLEKLKSSEPKIFLYSIKVTSPSQYVAGQILRTQPILAVTMHLQGYSKKGDINDGI